jgi:Up-frameshift suppressor 2
MAPTPSFISFASKQIARLPWADPVAQCGVLVTRLMLKACRRGRYRTINAIAAVAARLRTQRNAGEVTVRLVDAVLEELRWALEHPNFRDQQRVLTYARLLGELYEAKQVSGPLLVKQLYDFINLGHEIPEALREASKKLAAEAASATELPSTKLPVYNSASGVSQTIMEDEEMDDDELVTMEAKAEVEPPKPVAVSEHSKFDPRVPAATDPPNSAYRIKLVCTLLEVAAPSIVTRSNLSRMKGFLAAFQRYLFTKTLLPTDVEFSLLDTFDILDSHWKQATKNKKAASEEEGFPRYATWLDAHNATVAFEEADAVLATHKADLNDAGDVKSATHSVDGHSARDDDTVTNFDEEDIDEDGSLQSDSEGEGGAEEDDIDNHTADDEEDVGELEAEDEDGSFDAEESEGDDDEVDDGSEEDGEESVESDYYSDEEEEFDEEAYMRQMEEEEFERELRRMTLDAIERGKNTSRKLVADIMPSGSQISKKKGLDPTPAEAASLPPMAVALGGKEGISFQVLKKGSKGKVETRDLVVPKDTNLAVAATKKGDEAARERDVIKQRVLQYEAESAYAGGNVYLEQEKLQVIRNRPLSLDDIDRNFGTTGGTLRQGAPERPVPANPGAPGAGRAAPVAPAGRRPGPGRGSGGRGRGRGSSGRTLFR